MTTKKDLTALKKDITAIGQKLEKLIKAVEKSETKVANVPRLFPRLRSEKMAPAGQLSEPKLELQLSNPNKPEIINLEHTNRAKSKEQIEGFMSV